MRKHFIVTICADLTDPFVDLNHRPSVRDNIDTDLQAKCAHLRRPATTSCRLLLKLKVAEFFGRDEGSAIGMDIVTDSEQGYSSGHRLLQAQYFCFASVHVLTALWL
ncbi:hypothetical protein Bpfe_001182 [Biomphalaria pfeifferi]|uniref:Uncharacterized protein n=1 Tax=Biomphalaria pfeifferi TaxID=112525 RepID=A0AAD8CDH9_BIOPF|nr:hypothetical protein Bpfe_001182 [Biomphalaria pfeifferi]